MLFIGELERRSGEDYPVVTTKVTTLLQLLLAMQIGDQIEIARTE